MSYSKPESDKLLAGLLKAESREPDQELDRLAHDVIGAAIEVHRQLGPRTTGVGVRRGLVHRADVARNTICAPADHSRKLQGPTGRWESIGSFGWRVVGC